MQPTDPSAEPVRRQLSRILASPGFARNERLARFLSFVVEQQLEGRSDQIKESVVGVEVFGRGADYNPRRDPVVRMEASKLRVRLAEYYASEGVGDRILIELPKGGYAPSILEVKDKLQDKPPVRGPLLGRKALLAAVLPVLTLVVAGFWWRQHQTAEITIAVLPFESVSADAADGYFADGLTDELIRNLNQIEGLAVRSRTSSFALKGLPRNVREAGRQLAADYILEGSTLLSGEKLRVNVQLVRVRDDVTIWPGHFDMQLTDIFAIQDEISRGIVNNLRLKLGQGRRRYETNVEAYQLYLRGLDSQGVARIPFFEQAIEKDPSFAPAHAGLASALAFRSTQFPLAHSPEELTRMRSEAEGALTLDPLLTEAYRALAMTDARDGRWNEAEKNFREAIKRSPHDSANYDDFAMNFLRVLGRNDEAIELLSTARRVDPPFKNFDLNVGLVLISARRYNEAFEHCQKAEDRPELKAQCLARVLVFQGRAGEAVQILEDPALKRNPLLLGFLGYAYTRSGRSEEATRMAASSDYPNEAALIFAGLDDKKGTLAALDRMAAQTGPQRVGEFINYPELAFLRHDPQLKALRKRAGLE